MTDRGHVAVAYWCGQEGADMASCEWLVPVRQMDLTGPLDLDRTAERGSPARRGARSPECGVAAAGALLWKHNGVPGAPRMRQDHEEACLGVANPMVVTSHAGAPPGGGTASLLPAMAPASSGSTVTTTPCTGQGGNGVRRGSGTRGG